MKHKILVYGTLRPGNTPTRLIPGVLYDLGAFPGIRLKDESEGKFVLCEEIEVDDEGLKRLDRYEGYYPSNPEGSLYHRVMLEDGSWIYQYNADLEGYSQLVEGGDWLQHVGRDRGTAAGLGSNVRGLI